MGGEFVYISTMRAVFECLMLEADFLNYIGRVKSILLHASWPSGYEP